MLKRLLTLSFMIMCLVFMSSQSAPTANLGASQAIHPSAARDSGCGDPYIDPIDGKCYMICCGPGDSPCHRVPCLD
jgi:hypothetical protein